MIVSSQILNISKDGYFTASPGNLLQCLTIITVKKCFLVFRWNCMYFDLCLLRLGLSLGTVNKNLSLSSIFHQVFICIDNVPTKTYFLPASKSQLCQPLLIRKVLQSHY